MSVFLYSVFDSASGTYNNVVTMVSDAVALRTLRETLSDENVLLRKYPQDYTLVCLGQFDPQSGEINPCRRVVARIADLLAGVELSGGEAPKKSQSAPKSPENGVSVDESSRPADADSK